MVISTGLLHRMVAGLTDEMPIRAKTNTKARVNPEILGFLSGVTPNPILPAISMTALPHLLWWQWRQRIR